jgi:hypothetical protein
VPIWLITSVSLPVARTTGRLMALIVKDLCRNPFGLATLVAVSSLVIVSPWVVLAVRARRTSRRTSIS